MKELLVAYPNPYGSLTSNLHIYFYLPIALEGKTKC
jgi:hypothetical protein